MGYSLIEKQLFSLIRVGLFDVPIDNTFIDVKTDWPSLYNYAVSQSLIGLTFEGVNKIPKGNGPDEITLMKWFGYSNLIRNKYTKYLNAARGLCNFYQTHDIDVLVLKGISLSCLYPKPELREFGDFDIYTFDKYEVSNNVITNKGIKVEYEHAKHSVYDFGDLHVENHKYFVTNSSKIGSKINAFLFSESKKSLKVDSNIYYPNATFNALFLLRHAIHHLSTDELTLKNIVDWGLFLLKDGDKIEWQRFKEILIELKMGKSFDLFTNMAGAILFVDLSNYHISDISNDLVKSTLRKVMNKPSLNNDESRLERISRKTKRLFSSKWIYDEGINPDSFWKDALWGSLRDHIKSPKFI